MLELIIIAFIIFGFISIFSNCNCCARKINASELGNYYGGLNVEGDKPYHKLRRYPKKRWYNIIMVLYRPMINNKNFDEIVKNKKYPMLENEILEINEHEMFKTMLYITLYEMKILQQETNKYNVKTLGIHFHQDINCAALIKKFDDLLKDFILKNGLDFNSILINYFTDKSNHRQLLEEIPDFNYVYCDSLISFSRCAGFESEIKPGEFLIPNVFHYYNIYEKIIYEKEKRYFINSIENMEEDSKILEKLEKYINDNYESNNPEKRNYKATSKYPVFHLRDILYADNFLNSLKNYKVTIMSSYDSI